MMRLLGLFAFLFGFFLQFHSEAGASAHVRLDHPTFKTQQLQFKEGHYSLDQANAFTDCENEDEENEDDVHHFVPENKYPSQLSDQPARYTDKLRKSYSKALPKAVSKHPLFLLHRKFLI